MSVHHFVLVLHVLGAGVVIGVAAGTLWLVWGQKLESANAAFLNRLRDLGLYALFWQILTGIHLFSMDFLGLGTSPVFWAKLGLVVLDSLIAQRLLTLRVQHVANHQLANPERALNNPALLSAVLVTGIAVLGVVLSLRS